MNKQPCKKGYLHTYSLVPSNSSLYFDVDVQTESPVLQGDQSKIELHLGQLVKGVHELWIDWSNWNLKTWFETLQYTWEWIIYAAVQLQSRKWDEQSPDHYRDVLHQSLIIWACACMCVFLRASLQIHT